MKVDYIIVGAGLAGLCLADYCLNNNKTFVIIDDAIRTSSKIAGGMFNPVVLKRFTAIWQADEQIDLANDFYPLTEKKLQTNFYHKLPIFRKFASIEEQNNWFLACDHPLTNKHLNTKLRTQAFDNITSPFLFGEVFNTGYINVGLFVSSYQQYLQNEQLFVNESFNYNELIIEESKVVYKHFEAKHIVFAEGFSMLNNPYFNYLPLDGTKGELLYVKIPDLKLTKIIKSNIFIIPIGNDVYKIGATYNWEDKTDDLTQSAKTELLQGLEQLINCPYEVIKHLAGVRPTVKDRRPLVGCHFEYKKVHILNGLGTRGVLLAPYLAEKLFLNIENNVPLDPNINVARYYKKLQLIK